MTLKQVMEIEMTIGRVAKFSKPSDRHHCHGGGWRHHREWATT